MSESILAVKALNQYRRRDLISYLGLRLYLDTCSGGKDAWITEISCRLSKTFSTPRYLKVQHFKEFHENKYVHRDVYLPTPNEALAETALITEISKHKEFRSKPYVYSYRLANKEDKSGVFEPYFNGFKERHKSIANACWENENSVVLYTDIKKFYPSILSQDALDVWGRFSDKSGLSGEYAELGNVLLENHMEVCKLDGSGKGILTGPAFSHVIANILLDKVDQKMHELTSGRYWRYVDDVVMVGSNKEIETWRQKLASFFNNYGLELHDGEKDFVVTCEDWLSGEKDFDDNLAIEWVALIADTKRFLLANPTQTSKLCTEYKKIGVRIPVLDYSNTVRESSYLARFQDWRGKYRWSGKAVKRISIVYLSNSAISCKQNLLKKFNDTIAHEENISLYERKRLIPKLRYLSGRLLYLLNEDELLALADKISKYPELHLLQSVMRAVATRDITEIIQMGINASEAAAQLLSVSSEEVSYDEVNVSDPYSSVVTQSLAAMIFSGIGIINKRTASELEQLACANDIIKLMKSSNKFIRDFACLHGVCPPRYSELLKVGFDRDEALALDVINQIHNSSHC